MIFSV